MNETVLATEDLQRLKARLEGLASRLKGEAEAAGREILGEDAELFRELTPSGDGALAESELERDVANFDRAQGAAARAQAALARMAAGTYGECVQCGAVIGLARLEAEPTAARCVACQTRLELRK